MFSAFFRICTLCLISLPTLILAQENGDDRIYLKSGTRSFEKINWKNARLEARQALSVLDSSKKGKPILALIRLNQFPDEATRLRLKKAGISLEGYVPNRAWVAVINGPLDPEELDGIGVRGLLAFTAPMKADTSLLSGQRPESSGETAELWVRFPSFYAADSVEKWLQNEHAATIVSRKLLHARILAIRIARQKIRTLAESQYLEYLQEAPGPDRHENSKSNVQARSNMLHSAFGPYADGLMGRNVVVGVGDDTDPLQHVDFSNRLINRFDKTGGGGHGLHTMGTVGGAGIKQEIYRGFAPKSLLVSQYYSNILVYSPAFYHDFGMRLTNNSYGQNVNGDEDFRQYDLYAAYLDQMGLDLPDLLHVFAAGNSGDTDYPDNPYRLAVSGEKGFGTVLKSYQTAKNVLTVGNIDSLFTRRINSSRGPVQDGRLKPEIVAEGTAIRSAGLNNAYNGRTGTSMSAPAVTGGAALLTEQYQRLFPGATAAPSALMKALLCNGATDLGTAGPDYSFGYGVLNLLRSSDMLAKGRYISGNITQNGSQSQNINIPANTAALKVMLCWNDPPAHPAAAAALVNDLDLTVNHAGNTVLPYVNNPAPASVKDAATRNTDRLNNIEQVVIDNPPAGTAQFTVKGFNIPTGTQGYFVVYDLIPAGTTLTAPAGGQKYRPGDKMLVSWESYGPATGFHLEYFDGSAWVRFAASLPSGSRQYFWTIPANFPLAVTRIRIIRLSDNQMSTSPDFTIMQMPVVSLAPETAQCEGMITISWPTIPNATGYELMRLQGDEMKVVATVPSSRLDYSFTGLSKDSVYWVAVRPLASLLPGLRSIAVSRQPATGQCGSALSDGDLALTHLVSPAGSGRLFTGTALTAATPVSIGVKNLDNTAIAATPATIAYRINQGSWVTENITVPALGVGSETTIAFAVPANLSAPGTYQFEVTLTAAGDQISSNNRIITSVSQFTNPKVQLAVSPSAAEYLENFAATPIQSFQYRQTGLPGIDRYDFLSTRPGGRIRTFVNTGIARSDNRALTLDAESFPHEETTNYLTGTYNLIDYQANNHEIRLDFWYLQHHQTTGTGNKVWVRGTDTAPWIEIFDLMANQGEPGEYKRSNSLELNDLLKANGQDFSSSTQIRWGQTGSYQAASREDLNGYTFDDIRLSIAENDIALKNIVSPRVSNCALGAQEPVTIRIYNSMSYPVTNIQVSYQIDNGPVITETIAAIGGGIEQDFTFSTLANLAVFKTYTLKCRVTKSGDNVDFNNEITRTLTNSPLITAFPYLQNFEAGNGFWFTDGNLSSWEYGTPSSTRIHTAASGDKAWKTSLSGNYNENEHSYLYSPCFQIGGLAQPTLSMMLALDLEDCLDVTRCDGAWVEYSFDGISWLRLGSKNEGTNWYNRAYPGQDMWSQEKYTRWHAATIPLPVPPAGQQSIRLRFVMSADPFENKEGIAIDDIHIYDNTRPIHGTGNSQEITQTIASGADAWTHFSDNGALLASFNPNGSLAPGTVKARVYVNTAGVRNAENTYYHDRNFVIQPTQTTYNPKARVRLFFTDTEMETMLAAAGCTGCLNANGVTDLGITKFSSGMLSRENGDLADNSGGVWQFIKPQDIARVPYDKGYYFEFLTGSFSEFWLSPAALFDENALPVRLSAFTAVLSEKYQALLTWTAADAVNFSHFEIQRAVGNEALKNGLFETLATLSPHQLPAGNYRYQDNLADNRGAVYYRLKMVNLDGSFEFSEVRSIVLSDEALFSVFPNPSADGIFFLNHQVNGPLSYSVADMQGRKIESGNFTGNGFRRKRLINLTAVPAGIYLIEVTYKGNKEAFKVIKK
ncbi:hypothetical protein GCM10023091_08980 [Ravibacter arvi]|uniref:Secreted protein (Por secretion system target) n=1 Tax=Ravibacter arvi TaxID=2051041 RepID=A0ABP8LTT0_9BACT